MSENFMCERLRAMDLTTCREAADMLEQQAARIAELEAARIAYASEFPPDAEGLPDVGSIHANIRAMKRDAERYRWLQAHYLRVSAVASDSNESFCLNSVSEFGDTKECDALNSAIDAAIAASAEKGDQ
jgi:hypothetical protein